VTDIVSIITNFDVAQYIVHNLELKSMQLAKQS